MTELFFGVGTSVLFTSLSAGIKVYGKKSKLSYYTTLSIDPCMYYFFPPPDFFMSSFSGGLEYNYSDYAQIQFGGVGNFMLGKSPFKNFAVPFLSANFRFDIQNF